MGTWHGIKKTKSRPERIFSGGEIVWDKEVVQLAGWSDAFCDWSVIVDNHLWAEKDLIKMVK